MQFKIVVAAIGLTLSCAQVAAAPAKNIILFVGSGMGITTLTAARIYAVGEAGDLTIDTLPEGAFVKTYSNDMQVTDGAAAMSAYMTGVKGNSGVLSLAPGAAYRAPGADGASNCGGDRPATTLIELAKRAGRGAGVVSTARVTDATPAASYAHSCARQLEAQIAQALVPGGAGYNARLGAGLDVVLGGGAASFTARRDGRDLLAEMRGRGYEIVADAITLRARHDGKRLLGLFAPQDMGFDLERDPQAQPSLAEMTVAAMDVLARNRKGYVLVVDGGRIDHALHATQAHLALQEVAAFDAALKAALDKARERDPQLRETLIVATADHDHTLLLNGYSMITGKTTPDNPGVLGVLKRYNTRQPAKDLDGATYTTIAFGTGEHRAPGPRKPLTDAEVTAPGYHNEANFQTAPGAEAHGGTDVYLGAIGRHADTFKGTLDNTRIFDLLKKAGGL
jgi:alkaline phosphatase